MCIWFQLFRRIHITVFPLVDNLGGSADVDTFIEKLEDGIIGISSTQRGYIIALYGNDDAAIGMLRGRLEAVCSYFTRVFDKLKWTLRI